MSMSVHRRAGVIAVALALLSALLLSVVSRADAATLNACKNKKSGAIRVVSAKVKCKKSESAVAWNTTGAKGTTGDKGAAGAKGDKGDKGDAGATGATGTTGAKGDPGQPQKVFKFNASQPSSAGTELVPLFQADGIQYSFNCGFALLLNMARILADGPSGTSYASGTESRPTGVSRQSADPWSDNVFATLGSGAKPIAQTSTLASVGGSVRQLGVWTATVEGPGATTWIHATIDADGTCAVRGTAIAIPNS
jgi:hypothetical protein